MRELYYISASDGVIAIIERKDNVNSVYYVHKDHLGSYDVITSQDGTVKQRNSFDPWGRRRNPANWTYDNVPTDYYFDRGFTAHEHLDQFGLINMNGRVFDPLMAMFLSPDSFIQSPDLTQNFNRYAYCFYNPLKYSDPTGMGVEDGVGPIYNERWFTRQHRLNDMDGRGVGYYSVEDILGSLYNATPDNSLYTYSNVNGNWYITGAYDIIIPNYKFSAQSDIDATYNEIYRTPGNHDSEIPDLGNKFATGYTQYINKVYTDGTPPPYFKYLRDYGVYEYTGESNKYVKTGDRAGALNVSTLDGKYDIYISPYYCDISLKISYQHELGHIALDVSGLNDVFFQESALYFRMYEITGNIKYWNLCNKYGNRYPLRYYNLINLIIRP